MDVLSIECYICTAIAYGVAKILAYAVIYSKDHGPTSWETRNLAAL